MSRSKSMKTMVEFCVTLNENIIVRREFEIDNYNPLVRKSVEWLDHTMELRDWLERYMILRSSEYMSVNADDIIINSDFLKNQQSNNEETFNVLIKVDGETISHRLINAKLFPPAIRYDLDIRPYIPDIRNRMVKLLSTKKGLTHEYMDYSLLV